MLFCFVSIDKSLHANYKMPVTATQIPIFTQYTLCNLVDAWSEIDDERMADTVPAWSGTFLKHYGEPTKPNWWWLVQDGGCEAICFCREFGCLGCLVGWVQRWFTKSQLQQNAIRSWELPSWLCGGVSLSTGDRKNGQQKVVKDRD